MAKFEKGHSVSKGKGRPAGSANKINADVKEMTLQALTKAGGAEYLFRQSKENPVAFMSLVSKLLPKDVNVKTSDATKSEPIPATNSWLGEIIAARPADADKGTLPH